MHIGPFIYTLAAAGLIAFPALGQSETAEPILRIELNRIDQIESACRLTFLADNTLGSDVGALSLETVLLDAQGVVNRLTLFDFGALPDGVPRVRQFDVPDLACDSLGRVIINGVAACDTAAACDAGLEFSTRTDVEVIG